MAERHVGELGTGSQNLRMVLKDAIQQKCSIWNGQVHTAKRSALTSPSQVFFGEDWFLGSDLGSWYLRK